jgi:hypothetical protein
MWNEYRHPERRKDDKARDEQPPTDVHITFNAPINVDCRGNKRRAEPRFTSSFLIVLSCILFFILGVLTHAAVAAPGAHYTPRKPSVAAHESPPIHLSRRNFRHIAAARYKLLISLAHFAKSRFFPLYPASLNPSVAAH